VPSVALFLSIVILVSSFHIPMTPSRFNSLIRQNKYSINKQNSIKNSIIKSMDLNGAIMDFGDEEDEESESDDKRTDEEKGLTHGYELDFKIGDVVKVNKDIRIWSVKKYAKEGFMCKDFEGTVVSYALYGRKAKSLCSAITPLRVQFEVTGKGIPDGMFERKWVAHFAGSEVDLISKAPPAVVEPVPPAV